MSVRLKLYLLPAISITIDCAYVKIKFLEHFQVQCYLFVQKLQAITNKLILASNAEHFIYFI